jgi:archaellum component FlaC
MNTIRRSLIGVAVVCGATMMFGGSPALAQEKADAKPAAKLPLSKIVLFSSGVGYFEHQNQVDGTAQVELRFNTKDINDLLKSMVLEDAGGGRIAAVTYGSKDPITKTLKTFAVDLTANPTMADILGQLRGEQVEVEMPDKITGTIVGLEKRKQKVGKEDVIEVDVLNLLTKSGLKSVPLEQLGRIRLLNEKLDGELRQALEVLATGHSTDKKTVTLEFIGEGRRPVRVGYIQESPIWKTSYRLVLKDGETPHLQGWAIVENTTEEDWNNVQLALISGRPISFVMDLYEPLYIRRPVVEPELFASLRPQKYDQSLADKERQLAEAANKPEEGRMSGMGGGQGRLQRRAPSTAIAGIAPTDEAGGVTRYFVQPPTRPGAAGASGVADFTADLDLPFSRGSFSVAQAGEVGELFQYVIDTPVTLERQKSAMLPIVNGPVEAQKVSIYNPAVQPKHPLSGFKLKNTTPLHLMQGPITVFDGGAYAGDAQIADLPPGSQRLVSYALDLDTEVASESKSEPEQLTSLKFIKGVVEMTRKYRRQVVFTVKNSGDEAKQVLIEYPHDANWALIEPKEPAETTRDMYRFAVTAEPGKPAELAVREEMVATQQVAVTNFDDNAIQVFISNAKISEAVKQAMTEVVRRRQALGALQVEQQQVAQQIAAIAQEQERIRQNMAQLEKNTELYARYVKKFGEQEDQIEKLRARTTELAQQIAQAQQAINEYIANLSVE